MDYFRDRGIGYSGWAWWAGSCGFPSLIADSSGRCAEGDCTTQADLAAYSAGTQRPSIHRFSPLALCPACAYDFEDGTTQGWQVRWGQSLSVTPTTSPAYSGTHALALSVRGAGYPGVGSRRLPAGAVTGASVTYHVWAPVVVSAGVAPYLLDGAWAARLAPATQLRPGWTTVGFVLPAGTRATELGLQVNSTGWAGQLVLDAVEVSPPAPPARYDFENESTQGWQVRWGTTLTAVTATAPTYRGSGSLTLTVSGAGNPAIGTRDLLTGLGAGTVVTFHLWGARGGDSQRDPLRLRWRVDHSPAVGGDAAPRLEHHLLRPAGDRRTQRARPAGELRRVARAAGPRRDHRSTDAGAHLITWRTSTV